MKEYSIDNRNKVKRVPNRGHYDKDIVYTILDAGSLSHVGFSVDGQPFVIPTLYGRSGNKIYFHGASSSRMLKNMEEGIPVCITVTHVDGLVVARSIFHHSMNYRSVVAFGTALKVPDDRKEEALTIISENIIEGRWEEARKPNAKELKATAVLEMEIEQASAKIRQGPASDDKEDYELDIWAGVIPMSVIKGAPESDELLKSGVDVPNSVKNFLIK